jgi:hypothetical protein
MFPMSRLSFTESNKEMAESDIRLTRPFIALFHGTVQRPDTLPLCGTKDRTVTEIF